MKKAKTDSNVVSEGSLSAEHVLPASPNASKEPDSTSLAQSYARFLPLALKLPKEQIVPLRIEPQLLVFNVQTGLLAVQPFAGRLQAELPKVSVADFPSMLPLAEAVLYASGEATRLSQPAKRSEIEGKLKELLELREPMLLIAEGLALRGLLPRTTVAQIRSGTGQFDAAMDGRALCDLYTQHKDTLAGKHPFTAAEVQHIGELGTALMRKITPDGARVATYEEAQQATERRDRLYTLLVERHADLRKAGFYLFGEEVDQKVPILGARAARKRGEAALSPEPAVAAAAKPAAVEKPTA